MRFLLLSIHLLAVAGLGLFMAMDLSLWSGPYTWLLPRLLLSLAVLFMLPVIERLLVVHYGTPWRAPALPAANLVAIFCGVWLGTYGHFVKHEILLMAGIMICLTSLSMNFAASCMRSRA